ncbi:HTH-type transcriptional regulator CysL [Lysinibacillus alkalisoli]|uniref:HTH-type transcriptional regulator CysL n=1 Tax=Lysinibacillus alkalisoli TaxID=1911548 RepID=A0A917LK07_9BACI|nr:LysR family transcriptional regulator [Lysinibacillus alkalisoli]GGG33966.1 HTH-type transcriptional regulator CysL [Lysinibacillus alkalisoli]
MHYDALRTFVTVVEEKNFTRAAEHLFISQPSVSLLIKNLEKEFATTLLIRSPQEVRITPTGEMLYRKAKQILALYEQAHADISDHHHIVKGTLWIAASFTIGEQIIPQVITQLKQQYPQLQIHVKIANTADVIHDITHFTAEIGVIEGETAQTNLTTIPFMQDELLVVASPSLTVSSLYDAHWLIREEGSGTHEFVKQALYENDITPMSFITVGSNQGIKESVMAGLGVSILSKTVVKREIEAGLLIEIPWHHKPLIRSFSYVYESHIAQKRSVQAFVELLNDFSYA